MRLHRFFEIFGIPEANLDFKTGAVDFYHLRIGREIQFLVFPIFIVLDARPEHLFSMFVIRNQGVEFTFISINLFSLVISRLTMLNYSS